MFGLIGDVFVVASDERRARAAAREPTAPVPGSARRERHARARDRSAARPGPAVLGVDPGPRGEMTGSVQASRERLRATARLRMP